MKKTVWILLVAVCGTFLNLSVSNAQDMLQDKINLSREGGTTRRPAGAAMQTMSRVLADQPIEAAVEAYVSQQVVTISVQNYRGEAWIEIVGPRGVLKQTYTDVRDMGFEAVNLSGLDSGEYTIRVTLGTEVYTGEFKK
ncbi:DUF3244 domain-containing protein [Proteiniphilum sp.]|uniref:DUF3244 domain-containing protein n=1 Tax=Proteiniphilum sp. TaxID=1926877 RepID=UPI002B2155CC|nr:DUF3244 domain-containing protein [Proteiniphilum sp.]MEA4916244.1 DUF3244 domain-containing protein [Proteiniphilum sp.]